MNGTRCVVFGYSEVGVRCLKVLLSAGADVALVVSHEDDPSEQRWYGSVADTARDYGVQVITPADPTEPGLATRIRTLAPDFIFSFYYRQLLPQSVLALARCAALNLHGSLLPRYRGRAPLNWAVVRGETETGATLHHMVARADAGNIVDQQAIPILRDDDAREVFAKLLVAAEMVLHRSWPRLLAGTAASIPQPILPGEYFGRRGPQDGHIDWSWPAQVIHDLVRAVAPPFPGAFGEIEGQRIDIHRTRVLPTPQRKSRGTARFIGKADRCIVQCTDGSDLLVLAAANAAGPIELAAWSARIAARPLTLWP